MPVNIHFIWAGEPAQSPVKGQDTIGPDLMRKKYPGHPIYFWCLTKEIGYYQSQFNRSQSNAKIIINSIEQHAQTYDYAFYLFIEKLKATAMTQTIRANKARDYTTLKEAFQFFLQIHYEGYFLDTNIIPNPSIDNTPLPELPQFSVPYCETGIDPWLMYSPSTTNKGELAKHRFNHYIKIAKSELYSRPSIHEINRPVLGHAFVNTAQYLSMHLVATRASGANVGLSYRVNQFQKRYFNTHHQSATGHIFYNVLYGLQSIDELQYLLKKSHFDTSNKELIRIQDTLLTTTLLHTAISLGRWQELNILLPYAHNPEVIAESLEGQTDSIIKIAYESKCLIVLINYYIKRNFAANSALFILTLNAVAEIMSNQRDTDEIRALKTINDQCVVENISALLLKPLEKSLRNIIEIVLTSGPIVSSSLESYVSHLEKLQPFHPTRQKRSLFSYLLQWFEATPLVFPYKLTLKEQLQRCIEDLFMKITEHERIYQNNNRGVAVYRGTYTSLKRPNGIPVVIKKTKKEIWDKAHNIQREILFKEELRRLSWHKNLTRCYKIYLNEKHACAIYEPMDGSLTNALRANKLPINIYKRTAEKITRGLRFLHEKGYLHRDIKPDNILVSNDWEKVKICDYGFIIPIKDATKTNDLLGSLFYMPPELARTIIKHRQNLTITLTYTIEMDMYSLARTLLCMLNRRTPFSQISNSGLSPCELQNKVLTALATPYPIPDEDDIPSGTPTNVATMISLGLNKDPNLRPKTEHFMYLMAIPDAPIFSTKSIELHSRKRPQAGSFYPAQHMFFKNESSMQTSPLKSMSGRYRFWSECNTTKTSIAQPESNDNIFSISQ